MKLNANSKRLIQLFINDITIILNKYASGNINKDVYFIVRDEINCLYQLYKNKNKIFDLIFAYPRYPLSNALDCLVVIIGAYEHLQNGIEINKYIVDCVNAKYLLHNL